MNIVHLKDYQTFAEEKMKKLNVFETPRFFCDVYCFEPGQVQKAHSHGDQDKLYFVLEGQGTFQVGSESQILEEGQGTMAQRVRSMGWSITQNNGFVCWCLWPPILGEVRMLKTI